MRAHLPLVLAILLCLQLVGCGGGGGTPPNPIVFTRTIQADATATSIDDTAHGIKLIIPAGTFTASAPVTLVVLQNQRSGVVPQGFTSNANAVNIIADIAQMAADGTLMLEIPFDGPFDQLGTMMMITDDRGGEFPLDVAFDAQRKVLTGTIPKAYIQQFGSTRSRAGGLRFGSFLLNGQRVAQAPSGRWFIYRNAPRSRPGRDHAKADRRGCARHP